MSEPRDILAAHLTGRGVEIGALHMPMSVPPDAHVYYIDCLEPEGLQSHYPELDPESITSPDVVCEGETLAAFLEGSLDFIVASHVLEHLRDPIRAIRSWVERLRPGGILFLVVPDRDGNDLDRQRDITSMGHLLHDHLVSGFPSLFELECDRHYEEWAQHVSGLSTRETIAAHVDELKRIGYSIHFHTFKYETLWQMIRVLRFRLGVPIEILSSTVPVAGAYEHAFLLQRSVNEGASDG